MVRYPPLVLNFAQTHPCDTPFCNVSRDNCAIPHKNKHEKVLRYYRYKHRADMKSIASGPLSRSLRSVRSNAEHGASTQQRGEILPGQTGPRQTSRPTGHPPTKSHPSSSKNDCRRMPHRKPQSRCDASFPLGHMRSRIGFACCQQSEIDRPGRSSWLLKFENSVGQLSQIERQE